VSWEALAAWGDAARLEQLSGGVANDVWTVRVDGKLAVARLGRRSADDLAWEARLLRHLDGAGIAVPVPIPTLEGLDSAGGVMVMHFVPGEPARTESDWRLVADVLRRVHQVTRGWPQRPGWRSSVDLVEAVSGTRVDLSAMPQEAVLRCRAAWARLRGCETCVVHGNPANPANIRVMPGGVALIDWDEARVDVADLDLMLPFAAGGLEGQQKDIAIQAAAAWEAAVCWPDDHARRQLARVRNV
jgi:Ser/Thr protein kinase RdoA (MazF antagonist)